MKLFKVNKQKKYVFAPDYLFDGVSSNLQRNFTVTVINGVIESVNPFRPDLFIDGDFELVKLPGVTLMPGLVDCHVHLAMNGINLNKAVEEWETHPEKPFLRAAGYLNDYLAKGIVAIRDGGDKANLGLQAKIQVLRKTLTGPIVSAAGRAIYRKGMYGNFLGPGFDSINEALEQIKLLREQGADHIKVVLSGLVSFKNFGQVGGTQFPLQELKILVEEAHKHSLKVMAHASSAQAVETGVLAGVDSIEHGYFITEKQLELMKKHNTAWVPTLAPLGNLLKKGIIPYNGADLEVIQKTFDLQLAMLYKAYKAGVIIGIGTDAGANLVFHGRSYHDEIYYYGKAGILASDILKMATSVSAGIAGQDETLGTITPGKLPYWVCTTGNPFENPQILRHPTIIIIPE